MTNAVPIPEKFKVSKSIRDELSQAERTICRESLWEKSQGKCAICNGPLPVDGLLIDVDHLLATNEGQGGQTVLANLYLAHRACNRSRKNLPFDLAKRVVRFSRWCATEQRRSFDEVVEKYVPGGNKRTAISMGDNTLELDFGQTKREIELYEDPATKTLYGFVDVPIAYIQNDQDSQPRFIEPDHVRTLAVDFSVHPVHEPSNCRLVSVGDDLADLKQFDGQHKTTAQIILGRTEIPMKIYVNPEPAMIQELVVQIQQGIKKRPLSTTDTLKKLDDVVQNDVEEYRDAHQGESPSEKDLVGFQPLDKRNAYKKTLIENFEYAVLRDPKLKIGEYISTRTDRSKPLTDRVLVTKLIRPLVCQELLDEPIDDSPSRETERDSIVQLLNQLTELMLEGKWKPETKASDEDVHTRRARVFFQQGAIGWWLKSIFLPAFQPSFTKARWKQMFVTPLDDAQQERLEGFLEIICGWDIWSTTADDKLSAFRSNTVANVEAAIPDFTNVRLANEFNQG